MAQGNGKDFTKKPIYKEWWFLLIMVICIAFLFNSSNLNKLESSLKEYSKRNENVTSSSFVKKVNKTIQGAIGSGGKIKDVVMKNGELCISVDLSNTKPTFLTTEDLAISRTSSITDEILELTDYYDNWTTITVDFGDIGKITITKKT